MLFSTNYTVAFVDSIATSPTTRLDLMSGQWRLTVEGTSFPPPELRRSVVSTLLVDGEQIPSAAYANRTITLRLHCLATTDDDTASAIQDLAQELDRPANFLKWQPGTTQPVFFRTLRADYSAVQWDQVLKMATVSIPAEPFAYGLKQTLPAVLVNNDPAATSGGMFLDVDTTIAQNLNPYFETNVTNWTGGGGATLTRSTAQFHQGAASMLITPDGVTATPRAQSDAIAVTVGKSYFASGWLRSPGTPTVGVRIRWYSDAGATVLISSDGPQLALVANTWTYFPISAVAPATAVTARVAVVYTGTPTAIQTCFCDEVIIGATMGVLGDVETPLFLSISSASNNLVTRTTVLGVRRRGIPSRMPMFVQCESASSLGTDTTVVADASMSGGSKLQCTFGTATLIRRWTITNFVTETVDARGTYRAFIRCKKTTGTDTISMQLQWGAVLNDVVSAPADGSIRYVDLGLVTLPIGPDPVIDGYSGTELAVAASAGNRILFYASRSAGAGSLDMDELMLVPADDRLALINWGLAVETPTSYIVDSARQAVYDINANGAIFNMDGTMTSLAGLLPMASPNVTTRIVVMRDVSALAASGDLITDLQSVTPYYWPRYLFVRPAAT